MVFLGEVTLSREEFRTCFFVTLTAPTCAAFGLWQLQASRWHSGPFSPVTFLVLFARQRKDFILLAVLFFRNAYVVFSRFYPFKSFADFTEVLLPSWDFCLISGGPESFSSSPFCAESPCLTWVLSQLPLKNFYFYCSAKHLIFLQDMEILYHEVYIFMSS